MRLPKATPMEKSTIVVATPIVKPPQLVMKFFDVQKISPAALSKHSDQEKLANLIRSFFDTLHGFHIQFNVVSRQTLLDAQKNPEKHAGLIVRVAGYSAFFNVLSKQTQDDIIARTEQVL